MQIFATISKCFNIDIWSIKNVLQHLLLLIASYHYFFKCFFFRSPLLFMSNPSKSILSLLFELTPFLVFKSTLFLFFKSALPLFFKSTLSPFLIYFNGHFFGRIFLWFPPHDVALFDLGAILTQTKSVSTIKRDP